MKKAVQCLVLLMFQVIFSESFAQNYTQLQKSDTISIGSDVFGKNRKVIVSTPLKYDPKNPNVILYMDANDKNINGTILQAADDLMNTNEIPQSYLIGIIQENRNEELLEKSKLLMFITHELMPFLRQQYAIPDQVTIVGHSFGAYFATYAYLSNNTVFKACVAISPAYWPNSKDIFSLIKDANNNNALKGSFYLAIGDKRWDDISLRDYVFKAEKSFRQMKNIRFSFTDLKGFSHNATPSVGYALGLGFIYDEWEWANILEEQNKRLQSFPDFWGHLEIKADALYNLNRKAEAKEIFEKAIINLSKDEYLSDKEKRETARKIKSKIKRCYK